MSADPITDKAVDAAARAACTFAGVDYDHDDSARETAHAGARAVLEAAVPHLADQPATTGGIAEAIEQDERDQADAVDPERRPSSDYLAGYRAATKRAAEIARQSADRDTETAALRDAVQMVKNCIGHPDTGLTPHSEQIAALRAELAIVREMLIAEHVHTTRGCGHDVGPMEVEGASDCAHCGPYHGATEFCPARCDVVRVEHDHATASRRGGQ
jgi:hypothetical protein